MLAAAVVLPLIIGLVIDGAEHSGPVFVLIGLFVGLIAAVALVWTRFRRYM